MSVVLPLSVVHSERVATHWSFGGWSPAGEHAAFRSQTLTARAGIVWVVRPGFAAVVEATHDTDTSGVVESVTLLSPGVRIALRMPGGVEIAPGIAVPLAAEDGFRTDGS